MNADAAQMNVLLEERNRLNGLSRQIIGRAQRVSSSLGRGFLEKVYEKGHLVGDYIPDLLVENSVIIEIKAVASIDRCHRQQCLNYLRASDLRLGLLLNFGTPRLEVGRVVNHF